MTTRNDVRTCRRCGLGISLEDPLFHAERYGHDAEWDEEAPTDWTTFVGAESAEEAERLTREFMRDNEGMEVTEISSVEPGRGPFGAIDLEDGFYLAGSWKEIGS